MVNPVSLFDRSFQVNLTFAFLRSTTLAVAVNVVGASGRLGMTNVTVLVYVDVPEELMEATR